MQLSAPHALVDVVYPQAAPTGVQALPDWGNLVGQNTCCQLPFTHWQFDPTQPTTPPGHSSVIEHAAPSVQGMEGDTG
jgi:hypothetical protein